MGSKKDQRSPEVQLSTDRVTVGVLGPLEVSRDGHPVSLASNRLRAILAVLATSVGTPISAETIGDRVWGDQPPVNVRRSVQTWVARLRAVLGAETIASQPAGYLLMVSPEQVDARRFSDLLDAAVQAPDPDVERALIKEAFDSWRGTPFDGVPSRWLEEVEAARLTERYLTAVERAADLDIDAGNLGDLMSRLRAETTHHPLRESLWARLLVMLAGSGRYAEALTTYETIRHRLADELGVDPGPDLRRVYTNLLTRDSPSTAPAPVTRPRQLPADLELFVGRSDALAAMDDLMLAGGSSATWGVIVAIDGKGGAGKTSLAVHWAHRRRQEFPDGQLFIDLRGYAEGAPVEPFAALGTLLAGLGLSGEQIPADMDARAALLRTMLADRRILVVLDNARDSEQVRPLLPGPSGHVIVTSRGELRGLSAREGARRISLDQFGPADSVALLTARLHRHGVAVGEHVTGELAALCGHLPLALVIAAEHLAQNPLENSGQLIHALRDERSRLDALGSGDDPTTRVRSVFSWSYAALDPATARTYRQLGDLLPVDFSVELAAAVTDLPPTRTRQALEQLVSAHLLQRSRRGRYQFHDLLRIYAAERAEQEDDERDRRARAIRCLDWYLHTLHNAANVMKPIEHRAWRVYFGASTATPLSFDDHAAAMAWCQTERRNLEFATRRAYDFGLHDHTWRLAWQLGRFLLINDDGIVELVELSELGLASAREVSDEATYISSNCLGNAYGRAWRHEEAVQCFQDALASCRAHGDDGTESVVLMNLATSVHSLGDLEGARRRYEEAMTAARRWDSGTAETSLLSPNVAAILLNLGNTLTTLGRYSEGIARTEEALAAARRQGNRIIEGMSLGNLGEAFEAIGDYNRAADYCSQAEALLRGIGAGNGLVNVLLTNARVMVATGRPDAARAACEEGLDILRHTGDRRAHDLRAVLASIGLEVGRPGG